MKRVGLVVTCVLWLVPFKGDALPLGMLNAFLQRVTIEDAARLNRSARDLSGLDLIIRTFDAEILSKFRMAWQRAGNGTEKRESAVLILKMAHGSYSARMPKPTNEFKKLTFPWHPAIVAVFHTHPNSSQPYPDGGDLVIADKYKVPIFTLTSQGVYVYDPGPRRITRLIEGLEWLENSSWQRLQSHLGDSQRRDTVGADRLP